MLNLKTIDKVDPWGISLGEIKDYIYVTGDTYDSIISILAKVAREYTEARTWQQVIPATYTLYLDEFPDVIELKKLPIIGVTSVKYYDSNNSLQTLSSSNYQTDLYNGRIAPTITYGSWPQVYSRFNAVEVEFTCGYDGSDDAHTLPEKIKQGMIMFIKHLFYNRDSIVVADGRSVDVKEVPYTVNYLLDMESNRVAV